MSEFKFPCPQCRQHIQCDTAYAGAQIHCPECKQAIIVPPGEPATGAPPKGTIQIKISTLRAAGLIAMGILLLAGAIGLAAHIFAGPKKVTFRAYVDGTDVVKISGNRLWMEHLDFELPVRIRVNGQKWNPGWDSNTSTTYKLRRAFRPGNPESIRLTKQLGRGEVSLVQKPAPDNDETLAIKVDDGAYGGADWYEFTVSW